MAGHARGSRRTDFPEATRPPGQGEGRRWADVSRLRALLARAVELRDGEGPALGWATRLLLPPPRELLRHPAASRRDGRPRERERPLVALRRDSRGTAALNPLFGALVSRLTRKVFVPVVYRVLLGTLVLFWALLSFAPHGVAPPRRADVLHLGERLQPLRRVGLLGIPRRPLPAGAGTAPLRFRRRRRNARRRRRGRADGGSRPPPRPDEPHPPRGAPSRGGRLLRPRTRPALRRRRHVPSEARRADAEPEGVPPGSGVLSGLSIVSRSGYLLAISLFLLLFTVSSTFLYFEQARIVKAALRRLRRSGPPSSPGSTSG